MLSWVKSLSIDVKDVSNSKNELFEIYEMLELKIAIDWKIEELNEINVERKCL
jgi:hypothetical protein